MILCDDETFSVDETWLPRKSNDLSRRAVPRAGGLTEDKREFVDRDWQNARVGFQGAVAQPQSSEFRTKPWSQRSPASA